MRALLIIVVAVLLALSGVHVHAGAIEEFQKQWGEAGESELKKIAVLDALAAHRDETAAKVMVTLILSEREPPAVVNECLQHLASYAAAPADDWMRERAKKAKSWEERAVLVNAIGMRCEDDSLKTLKEALEDEQWQVQVAAIRWLARTRVPASIDLLIRAFEHLREREPAYDRLRGDLIDGLYQVTGETFKDAAEWRAFWDREGATWKDDGEERALMQEASGTTERAPKLFEEILSRRVVFVVDISNSMIVPTGSGVTKQRPRGATRMEVMVAEMKRIIDELPKVTRFNLLTFSDGVTWWQKNLGAANSATKKEAIGFLDLLKPVGATNSFAALEAAFQDPQIDTIYFLSDGFPTAGKTMDQTKIAAEVKKWNTIRNVRIHTIAFVAGNGKDLGIVEGDKSEPKQFMERLAKENGGRYRLVE